MRERAGALSRRRREVRETTQCTHTRVSFDGPVCRSEKVDTERRLVNVGQAHGPTPRITRVGQLQGWIPRVNTARQVTYSLTVSLAHRTVLGQPQGWTPRVRTVAQTRQFPGGCHDS